MELFKDRKLLIATKHQKERVIAPIFESGLGVSCFVPTVFDTDIFGTFAGEIERKSTAVQTVREKCLAAMTAFDCDLAIASEGSFGAHPSLFFAQADEEFMILIDKKNELEIVVREISLDTNFYGIAIDTWQDLLDFADRIHFPSHAIILRSGPKNNESILKGIDNMPQLQSCFEHLQKIYGSVYAETDMRAYLNPTRMGVIAVAAQKLLQAVQSVCPECSTPGFVVTEAKAGLPCEWCKSPTRSTLSHVYNCKKCQHTLEVPFPYQKTTEDPMYCDYCNP